MQSSKVGYIFTFTLQFQHFCKTGVQLAKSRKGVY